MLFCIVYHFGGLCIPLLTPLAFFRFTNHFVDMRSSASSPKVIERELDPNILDRIRDGDESAFNTLVNVYAVQLFRFAYVRTQDHALAEDAVQDVFAYLWERREKVDVHGNLRGYLYRSVANRVLMIFRHTRSQERVEQIAYAERQINASIMQNEGAAAIERDELNALMQKTLSTLPPRTREIFMLSREQGMSYAEIAAILNVGIPTIRNQVSRATQTLLAAFRLWETEK